jgi:uncharacterized membrane protein
MQIITVKKKILFIGVSMLVLVFAFFVLDISKKNNSDFEIKNVLAEDDNEEDNEDNEDSEEFEEREVQETISETSYQQVSDNVQKETVTTTLFDSDRDGIFDDEDTHPTINDFFIVKDDDKNGIVDKYEQ